MIYRLPVRYTNLSPKQRREVREQYITEQNYKCWYCKNNLYLDQTDKILMKPINLKRFPVGFMDHKIHLQHDRKTGLTEGAVHARCNAVLWQYEGR